MPTKESRTYRAEAIVLGHIEYGEADRILTLFTLEKGKISALARGIRKIRSRKAGHLEPFTHVNLFLAKGRNLDIITQAETIDPFMGLREDLQQVAFASYLVELLDRFTYEEGQNVGLFRLLAGSLKRLAHHPNPETVIHYYEIRLLDLLGFRPQLFTCIDCDRPIKHENQAFSPLGGGVVCPKCQAKRSEAWSLDKEVLRYWRHFQRSKWQTISTVSIPKAIESGMADLVERYLTYILERKLNTPDFLRQVAGNQNEEPRD